MNMLKDKVFKSTAYPFSKIFHFGQTDRVCRFCKKIFCCAKCRDRHVAKIHPDVNANCCLCASETLPMRQCEFAKLNLEDEKLLCHIVDKHLPLCCRLCGDFFESREDFKSIVACKWFERWHCLRSPTDYEYLEKKLKLCSISQSESCNGSRFCTPPEIYRKTSTPMFVGQKAGFETPCVPEFSLKTPKTNSPLIAQIASISKISDTQFFSFLLTSRSSPNGELTPFGISKDEQFLRNNYSNEKLSIMEEEEKITYEENEMITADAIEVSSPASVDLTTPESGVLQDSPKSDSVCEDAKKVRFSDQYKTAEELGNLMESCVRTILNASMEEEFHDARNETNVQKAKTTAEDIKDAKNTVDMRDTCVVEDARSINDSRAADRRPSLTQTSGNFLSDSQAKIIQDNTKNEGKKENRDEVSEEGASTANQRDSNTVLMMVLLESNSGGLPNDLMPLISSGLKKLQEQLISAKRQSSSSAAESAKVCRRSITTMKMSVTSVETYSADNAAMMTNPGQLASSSSSLSSSSSSSSSVQSDENNNNGGFLSAVAQAMKCALRGFSVSGLRISPRSIEETEVIQRREVVKELTSSQGSFSGASNGQIRPGKRTREDTESSKEGPAAFTPDTSPLAKRQKGWYKMIRGRQPIGRMRNNRVTTSPRGVSAETQVFSQGFLTVGDTVLPLPTRAHQSTE